MAPSFSAQSWPTRPCRNYMRGDKNIRHCVGEAAETISVISADEWAMPTGLVLIGVAAASCHDVTSF